MIFGVGSCIKYLYNKHLRSIADIIGAVARFGTLLFYVPEVDALKAT